MLSAGNDHREGQSFPNFLQRYLLYESALYLGLILKKRRYMKSYSFYICQSLPYMRDTFLSRYLNSTSFASSPVLLAPPTKHFAKEQMKCKFTLRVRR